MYVHCPSSGFHTSADSFPLTCPSTGGPLEFTDLTHLSRDLIDETLPGQWRYWPWLSVLLPIEKFITLGEGWTPLLEEEWQGHRVLWKMDSHMPTGSYKDRGVSVMVNWFRHYGFRTVMDDSSGNAGASLACYAARARLQSRIFVPADAPAPKRSQIATYGAELIEVEGPRHLAGAAAAADQDQETGYASHALHPCFLLGQMTVAFEIWEQLDGNVPDWLIGPVGNGGLLLGAWRGFELLVESGLADRLPRLMVVQVANFDPLARAFEADAQSVKPAQRAPSSSVADGISIINPARGDSVLQAVYQSHGTVKVVNDREVLEARAKMASRGIFVENTSATICAAYAGYASDFEPGTTVVGILSGSGLKNAPAT